MRTNLDHNQFIIMETETALDDHFKDTAFEIYETIIIDFLIKNKQRAQRLTIKKLKHKMSLKNN